jgi:FlaG/FlaF family flagellin (archaellin)
MSCKRDRDDAVTSLVGEMLMLTLVLILMAVFAATASNFLPPGREPSVTVWQEVGNTVILHHKGGDAIPMSEIRVIVNEKELVNWTLYDYRGNRIDASNGLFDLGGNITISSGAQSGSRIKLATSRTVIFTGVVT